MKTVSANLASHIAGEVTSICMCWLLKLTYRLPLITNITQANPAVVTTNIPHLLTTGDTIAIDGVVGMTEVNDNPHGGTNPGDNWKFWNVTVLSPTTFSLDVNSLGFTAYTSGGIVHPVWAFTTHDTDLNLHNIVYQAESGFNASAVRTSEQLSVDNLEATGVMPFLELAGYISEEDIRKGKLDFAELRGFVVNYKALSDGIMWLRRGWLGEIEVSTDGEYTCELRGMNDAASSQVVEIYSPGCRYDLGSSRCGVALASFTDTGSVTSFVDRANFSDNARTEADEYYRYGLLTWTSGLNAGLTMEVKQYTQTGGVFELQEPVPYDIAVTDTYSVYAGCDKSLAVCRDRFDNVINHGGFPHLPGEDFMFEVLIPKQPAVK